MLYRALQAVRNGLWAAKHNIGLWLLVSVVCIGGFGGWWIAGRDGSGTKQEVRAAVLLLRRDFAANVDKLDGAYLRTFRGVSGGDLHGDVVRKVGSGPCWGFEISFPKTWLFEGSGNVQIGDVRRYPDESCRLHRP